MQGLKAIQTRYKGYRFRSRLEARWAVMFDAVLLDWQYEAEGFETSAGLYLPDFYIPHGLVGITPSYVEVKPSGHDLSKTLAFARDLWSKYDPKKDFLPHVVVLDEQLDWGGSYIVWGGATGGGSNELGGRLDFNPSLFWLKRPIDFERWEAKIQMANTAARSARFEHGESP